MFFYQALRGDSPKFSVDKGFLKGYAVPGALYPSVPISQSKDEAQEGDGRSRGQCLLGSCFDGIEESVLTRRGAEEKRRVRATASAPCVFTILSLPPLKPLCRKIHEKELLSKTVETVERGGIIGFLGDFRHQFGVGDLAAWIDNDNGPGQKAC